MNVKPAYSSVTQKIPPCMGHGCPLYAGTLGRHIVTAAIRRANRGIPGLFVPGLKIVYENGTNDCLLQPERFQKRRQYTQGSPPLSGIRLTTAYTFENLISASLFLCSLNLVVS